MKSEKKILGKKRIKKINEENDETNMQQKSIEYKNENIDIKEENNITQNNNQNNDSINNNTINNSILIRKKDKFNVNNSATLFSFEKNTTFDKDPNIPENKTKNKNIKMSSPIFKNSVINTDTIPQKNTINSTITSKNKNINSAFSENSEDYPSSSSRKHKEHTSKNSNIQASSPKFKSNSQNTRNTAFGLKEISKRVMDIIKQSGQTTYRAISDQIVNEINEKSLKDEKNIRRRIYDSLNVMKSMKLFNKDKNSKTIMWNYEQEFDPLNEIENKNEGDEKYNEGKIDSNDIIILKKEIKEKNEKVILLSKELQGLKNVLERNKREDENIPEDKKLFFPFIVIEFQKNKDPKVNVALNENQTKAHFGFDEADAMYGDLDAVSKIGNHPNFSK